MEPSPKTPTYSLITVLIYATLINFTGAVKSNKETHLCFNSTEPDSIICDTNDYSKFPIIHVYTNPLVPQRLRWVSISSNKLTTLPNNLFIENLVNVTVQNSLPLCIYTLLLRDQVEHIDDEAFLNEPGCINRLDLYNNKLTSVPTKALQHLKELTDLDLGANNFETITAHSFQNLSKLLQRVSLRGSKIKSIEPFAFVGLENLKTLGLENNSINHIAPNTFEGLGALEELNLQHSPLTNISDEGFDGLPASLIIRLSYPVNFTVQAFTDSKNVNQLGSEGNSKTAENPEETQNFGCKSDFWFKIKLEDWMSVKYSIEVAPNLAILDDREHPHNLSRLTGEITCQGFNTIPLLILKSDLKFEEKSGVSIVFSKAEVSILPSNLFKVRLLELDAKNENLLRPMCIDSLHLHNITNGIEEGAFDDEPGCLRYLSLVEANLESIPLGELRKLKNLKELDLRFNNLQTLKSGSFASLSNLEQLDLMANDIQNIEPNAFSDLKNLKGLILLGNKLGILKENTFSGLSNLIGLELARMPFLQFTNSALKDIPDTAHIFTTDGTWTTYKFLFKIPISSRLAKFVNPESLIFIEIKNSSAPGIMKVTTEKLGLKPSFLEYPLSYNLHKAEYEGIMFYNQVDHTNFTLEMQTLSAAPSSGNFLLFKSVEYEALVTISKTVGMYNPIKRELLQQSVKFSDEDVQIFSNNTNYHYELNSIVISANITTDIYIRI